MRIIKVESTRFFVSAVAKMVAGLYIWTWTPPTVVGKTVMALSVVIGGVIDVVTYFNTQNE